jgi:cobalt-zinc-cadmium efflux system membrane fusion protein
MAIPPLLRGKLSDHSEFKNIQMKKILSLKISAIILLTIMGTSCSHREKNSSRSATDSLLITQQHLNRQAANMNQGSNRQRRRVRKNQDKQAQADLLVPMANPEEIKDALFLSASEEKAVGSETAIATQRKMSDELNAMGKVLANQYRKAIVSYPFPARVYQIYARVGDHVNKGQRLIVLQSEEVGESTSAFYKASADFELAKVNFDREQQLFEKGVSAKKNYLSTEAELKVAETNLDAAEKRLHVLGFSEEDVKKISQTHQINPLISLYAPIEGKIISSNMVLGNMVDESSEIMTIMDPSLLWVDAEIYEKDIARIKIGQQVAVTVPAYQEEVFNGKVTYISDLLNESTRTITVRTEVYNKGNRLKPGMFANLELSVNNAVSALVIPTSAVLDDQGKKIAFVKINGAYYLRTVQTDSKDDDFIAITSGIEEGEEVVTAGNFELKSKLYEEILKSAGVH